MDNSQCSDGTAGSDGAGKLYCRLKGARKQVKSGDKNAAAASSVRLKAVSGAEMLTSHSSH
jgi:hypothetical protein